MGIKKSNSKIIDRTGCNIVAAFAAAMFACTGLASSEPESEAVEEAAPTPTPRPRPDDLNVKKRSQADEILSRDFLELSLLKQSDVPGLKAVPRFSDPKLQKLINESFGLPAVMTMLEAPTVPPQWWSVKTHGRRYLSLGPTRHFERPRLQIMIPMLRLREVPYLKGDSEFVREMNNLIRLWSLGRTQDALKVRSQLQTDKKKAPRGTLERTAVAIVNGYLDMQLAAEVAEPLGRYGPALGSLWDALGNTELPVYIKPRNNGVHEAIFKSVFEEPALFSKTGVYPPFLKPPRMSKYSVDLVTFVRTLSLPSIFNVVALAAQANNWTRVFDASEKFNEVYAQLDASLLAQKSEELNFTTPPGVKVTHPIMMWPRTAEQMKLIIRMLRVQAQFLAQDPLMALRESAQVILKSEIPSFKALGFVQTANVYDDLGYPDYARRFHAFAEAFADLNWYQQNPYFLLGGAESSFWIGELDIARKAFNKLLLSAGDKEYGPWARLRLAELEHLKNGEDKAAILYEQLNRFNSQHPVALVARRRLFCINQDKMTARGRYVEYQELKELFPKMQEAEIEQVRACHVLGLMQDAPAHASNTKKSLPDDAAKQLGLITEFEEKFPSSSYNTFFAERKSTLQAALGPYLLAHKQCREAIEFFNNHEQHLKTLEKNSGRYLKELKWTDVEQDRMLRCATLFASKETLQKVLPPVRRVKKSDSVLRPKELSPLVRLAISMTVSANDKDAEALFKELRRLGEKDLWANVRRLETEQSRSIDSERFWLDLASVRVMQWDLEQPLRKKKKLVAAMRKEILRVPANTLESTELCQRFLIESATLTLSEWNRFVAAVPTAEWLSLLKSTDVSKCSVQAAREAIRFSQSRPSTSRDRHLLWPWLKDRGAKQEQEGWLALATRWSEQKLATKQELEEIFKTLEKEADNPSIQRAARAWREENKSSGLW
ncbi:MAG: hypothetical protein RJB13_162 [Pseudomonadota bacterium]